MTVDKPTVYFSALLYALAQEIRDEEGCVTFSADDIDEAAERMDTLTVTVRGHEIVRDELLAALEGMVEIARLTIGWHCTPANADGPLAVAERLIARMKGGAA